jgi:hypothetical protein
MSLLSTFYPEPVDAAALGLGTANNVTFASIQNTPIGNTTASTVAATNLSASGTVSGTGFSDYLAAPPAIGNTTPAAGRFTTLTANTGTLTASAPVLDLAQTWNNAAVSFVGLRFNITNTASASTSNTLVLQNNGTDVFFVRRTGAVIADSFTATSGGAFRFLANASTMFLQRDYVISWTNDATAATNSVTNDLILRRDAAATLGQRDGSNPQAYNIYNTFTSSTNHERGFLKWSSNVFQIGTEKGSGGGTARELRFVTDGTEQLIVDTSGHLSPISSNSRDLGTSSVRFRWGYFFTGIALGATSTGIGSSGDGLIQLRNNNNQDFNRLQFGGTTSSFPALKRSSATLQVRLADDSADAALSASLFSVGSGAFDGVIGRPNAGVIGFARADGATTYIAAMGFDGTERALVMNSAAIIGWSSGNATSVASADTRLFRDAANIIAQRNTTNAQAFRLYNTVSGTGNVNFDRVNFRWASNEFIIDAEAGGTGTLRGIKIGSATSSLLGFYGATPVDRPNDVVMSWASDGSMGDVNDAQDLEARTALFEIRARLRELGLMAAT